MRERFIPAIIMLIAGTVTSIINMINKVEIVPGLKRLLLILVIFYLIGLIAKVFIHKAMNMRPKQEEENKEEEESKGEEEKPQENT